MNKKLLKKICDKTLNADNIKIVLLFLPLLILLISEIKNGEFHIQNYFDTGIIVSFFLIFICNSIAHMLEKVIGKYCEDSVKLTTDYQKIVNKYSREKLLTYKNNVFPIIELVSRKVSDAPFKININQEHSLKQYELPSLIANNSDTLFGAHKYSYIYNNMNVRLDELIFDDEQLSITYSNTTYYDSLITNRAMDYCWENGKTIRDVYEPGPFLNSLENSKLSNHIGFNGFIETAEGKIIFVMRRDNLSIGKNTLANSIGASMKVKYCYNEQKQLTVNGIQNAIKWEIYDELKIKLDDSINLTENIFSFYRDLVEGGKPQFLFYIKLDNLTVQEFKDNFIKELNKDKKNNLNKAIIDGSHFYFYSVDELKRSTITFDSLITPDKKRFHMMPSASASIILLLNFLEK